MSFPGVPKLGWLNTLVAVPRNCRVNRSVTRKSFIKERSTSTRPGASKTLTPEFPNLPTSTGLGHSGSLAEQPGITKVFPIRSGRKGALFVLMAFVLELSGPSKVGRIVWPRLRGYIPRHSPTPDRPICRPWYAAQETLSFTQWKRVNHIGEESCRYHK